MGSRETGTKQAGKKRNGGRGGNRTALSDSTVLELHIPTIKVGRRHRRDLGDLDALARSMEEIGQLQAIAVTPDRELVFGQRRLEAARRLGWTRILARIVDVDRLMAERDENFVRKDFTPSERVSIAEAIVARVGNRQGQRTDRLPGKCGEVPAGEETAGHAARAAGFGDDTTFRRAQLVVGRGLPSLREAMDRGDVAISAAARLAKLPQDEQAAIVNAVVTGEAKDYRDAEARVNRERRTARIAEAARHNTPLTGELGRFAVVLADPPWRYAEGPTTPSRSLDNHYGTLSLDEIKALDLGAITTDDAILFLWATVPKLEEALEVMRAWGFAYRTGFVWDKEVIGMGYFARVQHEHLLVGTKGSPPTPSPELRASTVIRERRGEHSRKPLAVHELIERMFPALPRVELFARIGSRVPVLRPGWVLWGNEAAAAE